MGRDFLYRFPPLPGHVEPKNIVFYLTIAQNTSYTLFIGGIFGYYLMTNHVLGHFMTWEGGGMIEEVRAQLFNIHTTILLLLLLLLLAKNTPLKHIIILLILLRTLTRDRRTLEGVSAIGLLSLCAHSWLDLCSLLHLWSFFKKTKKGEGCTRVERKCLDRRPKWREVEAVFAKLGLRKEIQNNIESLEIHRQNL